MSHFTVLVIGPDPELQLAPFDENLEEPISPKWDWYQLGGRWRGFFKAKAGTAGEPGVFDNDLRHEHGVDTALTCDIDWAGMRQEAGDEAAKDWDAFWVAATAAGVTTWISFDQLRADYAEKPVDEVRATYWAQPIHAALRAAEVRHWDIDSFLTYTRETYIAQAQDGAGVPFAIVSDLRHWAASEKVDFDRAVAISQDHFKAETEHEQP